MGNFDRRDADGAGLRYFFLLLLLDARYSINDILKSIVSLFGVDDVSRVKKIACICREEDGVRNIRDIDTGEINFNGEITCASVNYTFVR